MARLAAIDIGSNALRLRIVDVDPPEQGPRGPRFRAFREVHADRAPVRLGHDVFTRQRLEPSIIAAACDALRRFRQAMDDAKVDRYRCVATSAAREAKNRDVLVERAEREAGVHVEIIEGVEEARLVQVAVNERLDLEGRNVALLDIGGGSTEITLLRDRAALYARSLPMGTVRLIEAFLEADGRVSDAQILLLDEYVRRVSGVGTASTKPTGRSSRRSPRASSTISRRSTGSGRAIASCSSRLRCCTTWATSSGTKGTTSTATTSSSTAI